MRLLSLLLIAPIIGCGGGGGDSADDTTDDGALTATLVALPGHGPISGTANVDWIQGAQEFTASAAISADIAGATRPWHVHFGTCASGGDIVGPAGSYSALVVGQDGTAQSTATVAFELDRIAPYSVNVHESQTALSTIIACGNLAPVGTGGGSDTGGGGGDDGGGGY
jgi:hypothetical protein